jgi:hypothetical protein
MMLLIGGAATKYLVAPLTMQFKRCGVRPPAGTF